MRKWLSKFRICLPLILVGVVVLAFCVRCGGQEATGTKPSVKAAVITCKGLINEPLYLSIRRRTQEALADGADYLIYEMSTYGGVVKAADDISKYFILEVNKKAHTVAYVTTEAISAGAMISVSCRDIVMRQNTTIGDAAPIMMGGKLEGVEREKTESFVRSIFDKAAEANKYPKALLRAMVSIQIEVYKIKNLDTEGYEFFEGEHLPDDPNKYDISGKELIIGSDRLLVLTASDAADYGVARAVVAERDGLFEFLEGRDGVKFAGEPRVLPPSWSEELIRWLNSPAVMGVLVLLAMLGAYIELSSPGVGLPGLVAVICVVLIIGSKYAVNLANWWEIVLFGLGVVLILLEIFVIPGFGVAGGLGIMFLLGGMFGMLIRNPPERLPWPETMFDWEMLLRNILAIGGGVAGFTLAALLLARFLPRFAFLSGLVLEPAQKGGALQTGMSETPRQGGAKVKIGDIGEVLNPLRPAGRVRFGSDIVDVVARGEFIEAGSKVEVAEIHGSRIVVEKIQQKEG